MGKYILLAGFCFGILHSYSYSQDLDPATWRYIDTSIENKKNLSDIYDLVQRLKQKALAEKKYFDLARCYNYQVLITDQRTEDSFYFRNSALFDSLLMTQPGKPELQMAMHLLQAKRLSGFRTKYIFNSHAYEWKDLPLNYAAFTSEELDSIIQTHFDQAKALAKSIPSANMADVLWISSDPLLFLFKPDLFDVVIAEQINSLKKNYYSSTIVPGLRKFINMPEDDFIANIRSLFADDKPAFRQLKYYKEWMDYQRTYPGAYYYIETLARKFVFEIIDQKYDRGVENRNNYESYLLRIASSSYNTVKAHAVYQLCLLWNRQARQYFPSGDYGYDYRTGSHRDYDTAYRYHAVKALQLFRQNKTMLDSFIYLKKILLLMEEGILANEVNLSMEKNNLPGEPLLAELTFRNAEKLYYSIVRRNNDFSFSFRTNQELIRILRQLPEVVNKSMDLPAMNDHNKHEAYLKIDALPAGSYNLLFSHQPLNDSNKQVESIFFNVTSIAVVNNNKKVFVLDRKTGFPLAGAKVKGRHERDPHDTLKTKPPVSKNYVVNDQGFVVVDDKKIRWLDVSYKNDSLYKDLRIDRDEDVPEGVYDKDEYDGLVDFYEQRASVNIFTDRGIYRPGQTVYFKAIFLTTDKNTGKAIVMSKENLGSSLSGSVYKKWLKKSKPELYVSDPFDRNADSIKIIPNEYGSVSGSFKIPKTAATGSWSIGAGDIVNDGYGGVFKVEEYKRPSYEVSVDVPKKELFPMDTFSVKVKVRSFAGAALNNVRVNYRVERSGYLPVFDSLSEKMENRDKAELISDSFAYTNATGELEIAINDSALRKYSMGQDNRWNFSYEINAEAVDATGESYIDNSSVFISSRPVNIMLPGSDHYNRDKKNSLLITTADVNAGIISKDVRVRIYRQTKKERLYVERKIVKADQCLYSEKQLQQWFPLINISNREDTATKTLVLEKMMNTGKAEKLELDPAIFTAGNYSMEAVCEEGDKLLGEAGTYFNVFDEKENKLPRPDWSFHYLPTDEAFRGDTLKYYNGNSEQPFYSIYQVSYYSEQKKTVMIELFQTTRQEAGINLWKWKVPADATGQLLLTQLYVLNNEVFTNDEEITIKANMQEETEIIIEKYRKKLSPGSKETFTVSVKTKNENTAAELMTTLYDASLDKLEEHQWEKPDTKTDRRPSNNWRHDINTTVFNYGYYRNSEIFVHGEAIKTQPGHVHSMWWMNSLDYSYDPFDEDVIMGAWNDIPGKRNSSSHFTYMLGFDDISPMRGNRFEHDMNPDARWSGDNKLNLGFGDSFAPAQGFFSARSNLKFDGYGVTGAMADLTGPREYARGDVVKYLYCPKFEIGLADLGNLNVQTTAVPFLRIGPNAISGSYDAVKITDISSLVSFRQPLIIIDGSPFEGDLSKIDPHTITQGIILKGADASAIYGAKAANGVLVLSTKGEIIFPSLPAEPPLPPRKNFNETAFFFPAIYADKDGYYNFTFTMPESVTEWNWKLLAHTKKAQFAYAEKKLNTQLPLMVQPNMPRLLYQGDRIILQSRITNLDSIDANGKAICRIEDAVTGEEITSSFVTKIANDFSVVKKANISSAFEIKIPKTQLNPVKIMISVRSQNFADGEEHIIPVLSPKILVRENIPFRFSQNADTTLQAIRLPAGAELYGIGLSILPKPQSALINALPWLANYSFDCAEQTFNKLLAHATALKIMRTDKEGQQSFDKAQKIIEKLPEQREELPDELSEEAMPWLSLETKTIKQQKQLFELLDTNRTIEQIGKHLDKLYKLQNSDGGLTWFDGGKSNTYISHYVLAGFGKLQKDGLLIPGNSFEKKYTGFIKELLAFCNHELEHALRQKNPGIDLLFYAYAGSFWKDAYPMNDSLVHAVHDLLKEKWQNADHYDLYTQAILIISTLRYFDKGTPEYKSALQQLNSIEQLAIRDDVNGTRWKDLADNDEMSSTTEETVALLAEAFSEAGIHPELSRGILKWLLTTKNEDHWSSTKATSAVIGMLSKKNNTATGITQAINLKFNNKELMVTDDALSGNLFSFVKSNDPFPVGLRKQNNGPASGNIIWYYFLPGDNLSKVNREVNLRKELFRFDEATAKWEPITEKTSLKIADKIRVALTIESSKALHYVYIDDKRAAAFEPKENHSGYQYGQGFSYYQSVRDAGMQFFSELIPAGRVVIAYEMIVAQEGNFTNGPASLQCMYRPEVHAYSNSTTIQTGK